MTTSALTALVVGGGGIGVEVSGVLATDVAVGRAVATCNAARGATTGCVVTGGATVGWDAVGGVATESVATAGGDGSVLFAGGWSSAPQKRTGANASAHARARALRNVVFIGFHF